MAALETPLSFRQKLQGQWDQGKFVCVGLDPDYDKIPKHIAANRRNDEAFVNFNARKEVITEFLTNIVDQTADLVGAYKPNIAFYEDKSTALQALTDVTSYIRSRYPHIPVIGDVKRADIGDTNKGYARAAFDRYGFDAVTTNPYFGGDTFGPFQAYEGKGLIVLCKTSNPGAKELQDMPIELVDAHNDGLVTQEEFDELDSILAGRNPKIYEMVSFLADRRWDNGQMGLVVGATHPEAFISVRRLAPNMPILIPGIGKQGGDLEKTLLYAPDSNKQGILINSSSGITFASTKEDYAEAARTATLTLDTQIRQGLGI